MNRMRDIFSAATRNNTSVFTLDPRGLAPSEFGAGDNVSLDADRLIMNEAMDSLRTLADQTDGRAIVNRNNPMPELLKMTRELSAYYLLGYTSTIGARDGKFHPIQVRVKRQGVEVRHRKGYWAFTEDEVRRASTPVKAGPPSEVTNALEELAAVVEPASHRGVSLWIGSVARRGGKSPGDIGLGSRREFPGRIRSTRSPGFRSWRRRVVVRKSSKGPVEPDSTAGRVAGRVSFDAPAGLVRLRLSTENARRPAHRERRRLRMRYRTSPEAHPMIATPVVYRARTAREIIQLRASAENLPMPTITRQFSRTERLLVRFDAYGPRGYNAEARRAAAQQSGGVARHLPRTDAVIGLDVRR
jgi:hypothetical protein